MDAPQYKSIEYQFRDQRLYEDYYALFSIGWEYWASPEVYYRDCRTSAYKQCVFQYTVSGEGTLVYNQKAYAIKPGQAFLIERPGQYQYYRSPNAKHWELKSGAIWRNGLAVFLTFLRIRPSCGAGMRSIVRR